MIEKTLSIVYTTSRNEPEVQWFFDSLARIWPQDENAPQIIIIDTLGRKFGPLQSVKPKPTIWQGDYRLTSQDWWAMSNARNTGLAMVHTEWVWMLDDRCVLRPGCVAALKDAMKLNYAVFGTYEKRHHMEVDVGEITAEGTVTGKDDRMNYWSAYIKPSADDEDWLSVPGNIAMPSYPSWAYGCCLALPMDWVLRVGGFEEACDGMGAEDTAFGAMLANNGMEMRFDPRMGVVQDRTPEVIGEAMKREDKGVSPLDKSHRALDLFHTARNTSNRHLFLQSRKEFLEGRPFPVLLGGVEDWYDGEKINENYMKP